MDKWFYFLSPLGTVRAELYPSDRIKLVVRSKLWRHASTWKVYANNRVILSGNAPTFENAKWQCAESARRWCEYWVARFDEHPATGRQDN